MDIINSIKAPYGFDVLSLFQNDFMKLCWNLLFIFFCRRRPTFPGSLTDLHRFRKTAHGHDGSSRIVMVRKTDQRTFASIKNGEVGGFEKNL